MKKFIFTLAALLMVGTAFADDYLYMEDFEVAEAQLGTNNQRFDVKAHFDAYVSAFQLTVTCPEGMTVRTYRAGTDLTINTYDVLGNPVATTADLNFLPDYIDNLIVSNMKGAYDADGNYMGAAHWAPGDYAQMIQIVFVIDQDFKGGDLILHTEPSAAGWGDGSMDCPKNQLWDKVCHVTVGVKPTPVISIELNQKTAVLTENETLQLTATILPEDATNKNVVWTSSDESIAVVDANGLVTAVAPGTTIITATTTDGSDLCASCAVTVKTLNTDNYFLLPDTAVFHGETIVIPVQMINEESIMAFQTDIYLPEGFTFITDEDDEPLITPSSRLTNDHVIMADQLSDGRVRVICYTPRSKVISGNEGDLFYITVAVPEEAGGDYSILLRNSLLTTTDYEELNIPDAGALIHVNTYIPGDVNDSRTVNVTDIVITAQYVLQRNPSPFIFEAADMNGDGNITVTDIMLIARLIMTPTANAPKRMPAVTANGDRMSGDPITLAAGETRTVTLSLDNEMDYSAFQFDLNLPEDLTASNFQLTDRTGNHALDVEAISNGRVRVLCYSPAIAAIDSNNGALLTFDVTANSPVVGDIMVDDIEFVTTACQTVLFDAFTIGVDSVTAINEVTASKTIARVDYFNIAGQRLDRPESGVTLIVTTYTDGTRTTTKIVQK